MKKIGFEFLKLAKNGDPRAFLKFLEQKKVFSNLDSLEPIDCSQLISSIGSLHLSDQRIWNGLENLFIKRERGMNLQDVLMCATAFGKKSSNDQLWRRIEGRILAERNRISEVKDVVLLFYAFANAQRKSPELWEALEKMTLASMPKYKQKELALAAWSFSKMNYGSENFWTQLEKTVYPYISSFSIQNPAITSYAFAKMNRKTKQVWKLLQSAVLASFKETSG